MPIHVLPAETAEDITRIFEICSLAFARNEPFWDLLYPSHWTPAGRTEGATRMLELHKTDPHCTFLKAVDTSTNTIVGMAKWQVYDNELPAGFDSGEEIPVADYWPEEEKSYVRHMLGEFVKDRHEKLRETRGNLVSLDILTIDPAWQRRGVGDALVKWGTGKADQMGVEACVESSVYGKGLYQKNGYVFLKDVTMAVPEQWEGRDKSRYAWLVRPKQGKE